MIKKKYKSQKKRIMTFFTAGIKSSQEGFTLVELILYVALISIFISGAVLFSWDIIFGGVKSRVQREVNQNLRFAAGRIEYEIRNASGVNSVAASDLCLASSEIEYNPTKLYMSSGALRVAWGGGSGDCTSMNNDEALTSDDVVVSGLLFTDLSSGTESAHINFEFTVSSNSDRQEWDKSQTYFGSVEIRSN